MLRLLRYFIASIILFHCVGVTQLASAFAKDTTAFLGMMNMSEEETKKEKETKEDSFPDHAIKQNTQALLPLFHAAVTCSLITKTQECFTHQYWAERPTPPPDCRA